MERNICIKKQYIKFRNDILEYIAGLNNTNPLIQNNITTVLIYLSNLDAEISKLK